MAERKTDHPSLQGATLRAVLKAWGQAGRQHAIPVTGHSMLPLIQDGDHVLVAHGASGVRRGDIALFRRGDTFIAHRVLHVYGGNVGPLVITKGDSAHHLDPAWHADEMVGRVLAVRRGDQHLSLDTTFWRALGWLIASTTLVWRRLDGWSCALKQRLVGPRPDPLTAVLRQGIWALSALALSGIHAVCCRRKA